MKTLGAAMCTVLMMFSVAGTPVLAENENGIDLWVLEALEIKDENTGHDVYVSELELLGSEEFALPLGAIGVEAAMDLVTGEFTVTPVSAAPDAMSQTGCIINDSTLGYGYAQDLVALGDATSGCVPDQALFYEHPGGILSEKLICLSEALRHCLVSADGHDFDTGHHEALVIFCTLGSLVVAQQLPPPPNGPAPTAVTDGSCNAYGFATDGYGKWPYGGFIYGLPQDPADADETWVAGLVNW